MSMLTEPPHAQKVRKYSNLKRAWSDLLVSAGLVFQGG